MIAIMLNKRKVTTPKSSTKLETCCQHCHKSGRGDSPVYGIGLLGALAFELTHFTTVSAFLFGVVRAIFWPAFLVYKALELLF